MTQKKVKRPIAPKDTHYHEIVTMEYPTKSYRVCQVCDECNNGMLITAEECRQIARYMEKAAEYLEWKGKQK